MANLRKRNLALGIAALATTQMIGCGSGGNMPTAPKIESTVPATNTTPQPDVASKPGTGKNANDGAQKTLQLQ